MGVKKSSFIPPPPLDPTHYPIPLHKGKLETLQINLVFSTLRLQLEQMFYALFLLLETYEELLNKSKVRVNFPNPLEDKITFLFIGLIPTDDTAPYSE